MSKLNPPAPESLPFETTLLVRDSCLCLHLQRAARALARRFDAALKPAGLTNGQFSLLMSLNRPQPAAISSVSKLLAIDRTTLTAALKPLQRRGLVEVNADPGDRRNRLLSLTEAGHARLAEAFPIWRATHDLIEEQLGGDPRGLRDVLDKLAGVATSPCLGGSENNHTAPDLDAATTLMLEEDPPKQR